MIILKLQGGLANQMFQYAFGTVLSKKQNSHLYLDTSFLEKNIPGITQREFELDLFANNYKFADKKTVRSFLPYSFVNRIKKTFGLPQKHYYAEDDLQFDISKLSITPPVYIEGFFQTEKYYKGYESIIKSIYQFPEFKPRDENNSLLKFIGSVNSVAIHFRRGDYVENDATAQFHGICSLDYYKNAIEIINNKIADPHYFVFSDDIEWVENTISIWGNNFRFVKGKIDKQNWVDMKLMSECKHNIIANSSYSWWSAWLNNNPSKIIIAPKQWLKDASMNTTDIIPESWISI